MADDHMIVKVINYIESNLEAKLDLDDIADNAGYSKFHLHRMFSEYVGCTLYKYIQTRRLTEAAGKLVQTEKSILTIAVEANYNSQQAFTLAFKQLYSCTPQQYRALGIYTPKLERFTKIRSFDVQCKGAAA